MQNLPTIATAQLPQTYEAAKQALAECSQVDECKDWSDKAAALASYAKQADDEQLERMAKRIRARALRRAGELLKQIDGTGRNQYTGDGEVDHTTLSQREAAEQAGFSKHQQVTSVRLANVPEEQFNEQVEGDSPPTISELAQQGIKPRAKPLIDLKGRSPKEFNAAMHYVGDIEEAASRLKEQDHAGILPTLTQREIAQVKAALKIVDEFADYIITRI